MPEKFKLSLEGRGGIRPNEIGSMTRRWACLIIILFALNAFSYNLGYISPAFSRLLGLLSPVALMVVYIQAYRNISKNRESALGASLILISILFLFLLKNEYWIITLPIFVSGFDLILRSAKAQENLLPALSLGSLIYAAFYMCYIHIPAIWMGIRYLSQGFSAIIGRLAGTPLSIGPTMSGTLIFLTFLFSSIAFFILSKDQKSRRFCIFSIAGLTLVYTVFILAHAMSWMTGDTAIGSVYIAFLMFLVPFIPTISRADVRSVPALIPEKMGMAASIAVLFAFIFIAVFPYVGDAGSGKVVIYERNCEMSFELPSFGGINDSLEPYDDYSVGAFGSYLGKIGYDVEDLNYTSPKTLEEALKDANILMIVNTNKTFSQSDLEYIWKFVRDGGNLIVFGDHTSMFVSDEDFKLKKDYLNQVLSPTGIRINPDTADYIGNYWFYSNAHLPHYISEDLGDDASTTSVGASLNLTGSARPVIIGRFAFSDNPDANISIPGHLGNRTYEKGEEIGDLVLVASDSYGRGNVLVFGDTSYIFNSEMPLKYKLARSSVEWLLSRQSASLSMLPWIALLALGILALVGLIYIRRDKGLIGYQASIAISIALSLMISGGINSSLIQSNDNGGKDIAWIDHSHLNGIRLDNFEAGSIDGLAANLMRNGYLPLILEESKEFSNLKAGDALVIIAPNQRYTPDEVSLIDDFVMGGGLLIISAGYDSKGPLYPLLSLFNISIGSIPLGSPPWIAETHGTGEKSIVTPENLERYWHSPKFMEAYPALAAGQCEPITWLTYRGVAYNLTLAKRYGDGAVVLIGDSRFLLDENLEYASGLPGKEDWEQYQLQWLGNVGLLRDIISKYRGSRT